MPPRRPRPGVSPTVHIFERDAHLDREFIGRWVDGVDEYLEAARQWTPDRAATDRGVDRDDIEELAQLYVTSGPAMLRVGWGLERNRNGGSALRSVLALPALIGQFGEPGAGVFQAVQAPGGGYDPAALRAAVRGDEPVPERRAVNMNRLGRVLTEGEGGPVDVLFVQGSNPAATCPQQQLVLDGLAREDLFTVVHDLTMTDTAMLADVVLPATSQFEIDEVVGSYGAFLVQDAGPTRAADRSATGRLRTQTRNPAGGMPSATRCSRSSRSNRSNRIGRRPELPGPDPGETVSEPDVHSLGPGPGEHDRGDSDRRGQDQDGSRPWGSGTQVTLPSLLLGGSSRRAGFRVTVGVPLVGPPAMAGPIPVARHDPRTPS